MARRILFGAVSLGVLAAQLIAAPASAQDAEPGSQAAPTSAPADQASGSGDAGEIVVTGFRRSLAEGLELKREAVGVRDSIVLDAYNRPDNPLMIPETGRTRDYARFFFAAVGDGAIGWAPFGLDHSRFRTSRPVTPLMDAEALAPFAANYALFRPVARLWARLAFEGKTWGFVEPTDPAANHAQVKPVGPYQVTASFGRGDFGNAPPTGNEYPSGGAAIGQIGPDEFLVTGFNTRIDFAMANPEEANLIFERVEQGHYDDDGNWVFERVVNGDQVDWGLNFSTAPQMLRVKIATYPKR